MPLVPVPDLSLSECPSSYVLLLVSECPDARLSPDDTGRFTVPDSPLSICGLLFLVSVMALLRSLSESLRKTGCLRSVMSSRASFSLALVIGTSLVQLVHGPRPIPSWASRCSCKLPSFVHARYFSSSYWRRWWRDLKTDSSAKETMVMMVPVT